MIVKPVTMMTMLFQLTSVNVSWCDLITQAGIAALSQGCTKLRTFISKVGQGHPCYLCLTICYRVILLTCI